MAEVKKKVTSKTKKSSKVLNQSNNLSNEELLEQILNKKKKNTSKLRTTPKKNNGQVTTAKKLNTTSKKTVDKTNVISSDDLYDKIRAKRKLTKRPIPKNTKDDTSFRKAIREIENENTDLIITREIRFDDLSANLKNKKVLEELKDAIEAFDRLDDFDAKSGKTDEDYYILPFIKKIKYGDNRLIVYLLIIFSVFSLIIGGCYGFGVSQNKILSIKEKIIEKKKKDEAAKRAAEEKIKKQKAFDSCLEQHYSDLDMSDSMLSSFEELNIYLEDNYNVSISYEDLERGYSYDYNEDVVYYGASTIKALGALYVYTKAAEGEIDLDETVTYTSKFKVSYSDGMKQHKLGSKISLRTLVKYSVIYSDNSAHQMLVSYIGRSNLKEFGRSLGAVNTLSGADNFGNISSSDGLIYMRKLEEFFDSNGELGIELKEYFLSSMQKELSINSLEVANKYGMYKKYYHNMGIIYDEHPYVVAIMTLEGLKDREYIVNELSNKIYELHLSFYKNRENVCKLSVYGE